MQTLISYRLIEPGSEWKLHRHWFENSAMTDLLDADFSIVQKMTCIAATPWCMPTTRLCSST